MARRLRFFVPRSWLHLPLRTARLRLTLLYSGMFLLLGTAVIGITYGLVSAAGPIESSAAAVAVPTPKSGVLAPAGVQIVWPPGAAGTTVRPAHDVVVQQHSADLKRLLAISWLVLAVTTLFSALLGWFASGRVLRPLRQMTRAARTISAGTLSERLALAGPDDEFKQLGDTLDDLLARLEASFEAQRRFVANASHELRTPLTLERTLLQVALADPDATVTSLRATCEELLAAGRDHEALLESLLTLASSERGLEVHERLDLAAITDEVLRATDFDRSSLEVAVALGPAKIGGDPALIKRLVVNLVDNAVRYNHFGGRIEVSTLVQVDTGNALLSVVNTGPLVPADELDRLFEPFQRLGGGRVAGTDGHHGLGLSIVNAIALAHGATVNARARPEGGLAVTVSYPPLMSTA
jgi:signal transduction histidine kinase